jgi:hypothetical protein
MKTFQEFILEAEIKWNTGTLKGSKKSPSDTAKQKKAKLERDAKQKPSPKVFSRVTKIKKGISGADALAKDTDPKPETTATRMQRTGRTTVNTGYAQTGRRGRIGPDSASSVGTVPNSRRRRVFDMNTGRDLGPADPSDVRIKNKYTDDTYGGRGTGDSRSGGKIGR